MTSDYTPGGRWVRLLGGRGTAVAPIGRWHLALRSQVVSFGRPGRVVLTAELQGGADDFEEYYCPTVVWEWGDDTASEATADCEPYEEGKSQIKRRFTVEHVFRRPGTFKVYFHMKRRDRTIGSASVAIQVQPGSRAY